MKGKHVVITGATEGIGKSTAIGLVRLGADLTLIARNREKAAAVAEELAHISQRPAPRIYLADLALPSQVQRVAQEIVRDGRPIDVLINNAGAYFDRRIVNAEGFEQTFALNHLQYFLLTHHLLPLIRRAPQGRIINVASEAHRGVKLDFDDLQGAKHFNGWQTYQKSKLANILYTAELARHLEGSQVRTFSLHPGFVASKFGHNNARWLGYLIRLGQSIFAISPDEGARTSLFLASSPTVNQISGRYFVKSHEKTPSPAAQDQASQKLLWQKTEELLAPYLA